MTQVTQGIKAILSHPKIYTAFQKIMGAHRARKIFTEQFIKPYPGMKILDIGCGPAEILNYLTQVEYFGFDICEPYIKQAKTQFKDKGRFYCQELCLENLDDIPSFDIVLAMGLLHHLDDNAAINLLNLAAKALKSGGRLVTIDACLEVNQNPIAKFLIKQDRGRNVRTSKEYTNLASKVFNSLHVEVRHQKWIPYTHCIMECITP